MVQCAARGVLSEVWPPLRPTQPAGSPFPAYGLCRLSGKRRQPRHTSSKRIPLGRGRAWNMAQRPASRGARCRGMAECFHECIGTMGAGRDPEPRPYPGSARPGRGHGPASPSGRRWRLKGIDAAGAEPFERTGSGHSNSAVRRAASTVPPFRIAASHGVGVRDARLPPRCWSHRRSKLCRVARQLPRSAPWRRTMLPDRCPP